jgi:hypothetical protein
MATDALRAHQGRGNAALYLADRIARHAAATRTDVAPDMENGDANVGDGSPEQEMEPLDPTIDEARPLPGEDDEEEPADDEMPDEEQESVEVIAIEVDTGDEDEYPPEEMAA